MSRPFAIIIVALVAITWVVYLLLQGVDLAWSLLGPSSTAVAVLTTTGFVFTQWIWHWPLIHYLTKTPRLTGTWVGKLQSNYIHEGETKPRGPMDVVVVVTQTANDINVRQYSKESWSTTVAASVSEEDGDRFSLATVYRNEPDLELQQSRSQMHYGATRLAIEGPARNPTRLAGNYWNDARKTSGSLDLKFVSRERVHSFADGIALRRKVRASKAS